MRIIVPKRQVVLDEQLPLFFLAGPVLGGDDWQIKMCLELKDRLGQQDFYVVSPCRWPADHWLSLNFVYGKEGVFASQTEWERYYLGMAGRRRGCIIFWLPCESKINPRVDGQPYARDTYGELGEWRGHSMHVSVNLVIGAEECFPGLEVIKKNWNQAMGCFPFYPTIPATAEAALKFIER